MSNAPAPVAGNAVIGVEETLTPEAIESVLADFRAWLGQLAAAGTELPEPMSASAEPAVDLHTLLGQFLALRHEVNLQTKAVRAQQDQNADTLVQLQETLDALEQARAAGRHADQEDPDERLRPLLKTLVDLFDVLGLSRRELARARQAVRQALEQLATVAEFSASPRWPRPVERLGNVFTKWFGYGAGKETSATADLNLLRARRQKQEEVRDQARELSKRVERLLESMVAGYTMGMQRVERALREHGLEPILCVGQTFDPEQMEVVEAVADSGLPAGAVVEEVRPGYTRQGRIFRYAQVRVAKP